ncbi:phosphonate ABC transporter, permease protein PhnE [Natronosporangium hydrolyticum]|uniref:Phosphonate ABC transporter, permease protein PhnE n=1 Tax=Natronosporangium hydrolyticum TaxID=2811111 RepID=A0A895YSG2_9ACTN|nr:phosphonate ABC transporter, permease protein PhnE [Natronosporangium hydrolyticum]QSB16958.1 phosphonate ABC transporter, permease protein PhnE [Natronosporangium hydrolyticum]
MSTDLTMPVAGPVGAGRPPRPRPRWSLWIGLGIVALITWWAGRQIDFTLTPLFTDFDRGSAIVSRFFDPNWGFIFQVWPRWLETLYIAVIAALVGNGLALFISLLASPVTSPNRFTYQAAKTVLSVVRSLPDVAYALLFVAAVSTGALAGILALIMFNIGINAKLTSETIDAVDTGPVEAADAAGANRLQRAWGAVVPQILPSYLSYSLYVFELNIRASVVIGIVGGGGIGAVIMVQLSRFNYENLGAIIVALFAVVFLLDRVSIWFRRRLV